MDFHRRVTVGMLIRGISAQSCNRCALRNQIQQLQQIRHRNSLSFRKHTKSKENAPDQRPGYGGRRGDPRSFQDVLRSALRETKEYMKNAPFLQPQAARAKEISGRGGEVPSFSRLWDTFEGDVVHGAQPKRRPGGQFHLSRDLADAFKMGKKDNMEMALRRAFYNHVFDQQFSKSDVENQRKVADLRFPSEWFPATRSQTRKVFLHVGPTNSGKTYQALQRLEQANSGIYAGPLRLLAHEVYTRMNAKGKRCLLVTGEEKRKPPGDDAPSAGLVSCTVEMFPTYRKVEVAVIDEIQMIGHEERGWAWTQAFMGVRAEEIHLCGEARTVPIIQEMCALIGDELVINRYERLSGLEMAPQSLNGDLTKLRKGDCIVSFSVMGIHALRKQVEKATGKKVAIVYGSLPPETRAQQARLFNEPDNDYDFLVASDAIGMGLNLAIRRVIFEASSKFDGRTIRTLSIADTKQIGGRAGRFRTSAQVNEAAVDPATIHARAGTAATALTKGKDVTTAQSFNPGGETPETKSKPARQHQSVGLVTTLDSVDYPIIKKHMESEPLPLKSAGILPPSSVVERFASYFPPRTPFSYILTRLHELSQVHSRFHLCDLKDSLWVADLIEPIEGLSVVERLVMCAAPASKTDHALWSELLPALARVVADQRTISPVDIAELPLEVLEAPEDADGREYLRELERLHKGLVVYLWLGYRFSGVFLSRPMALHAKEMVEVRIERVLSQIKVDEAKRLALKKERARALAEAEALEAAMRGEAAQEITDEAALSSGSTGEESQILSSADATDGHEPLGLAEEDVVEELSESPDQSSDVDAEQSSEKRVSSGSG
jgi:ATP-dependent RNA helicase SUPV3L1/SUV3